MTKAFSPEECFADERLDASAVRWACAFARHLSVERGLSDNTVRAYCIDIRSYLDWAARSGLDPLQVEYRRFRRYLVELNASGYTPKTVSRRLSAIRTFFKYLNVQNVTQLNPAAATSSPKLGRDLPRKTSDSDIERLLAVCEDDPVGLRDQAFLELLYASGARIAELARLELADVNFSDASIRLFGKGSKERIVPLYPIALEAVDRYVREGRPALLEDACGNALFVSTRGNAMSADSLRRVFKQRAVQAGLDPSLHPHDMRHAFATDLVEGGADLRSVQEMLGHASLSTTQVYTHLSLQHMKDVYKDAHPRS